MYTATPPPILFFPRWQWYRVKLSRLYNCSFSAVSQLSVIAMISWLAAISLSSLNLSRFRDLMLCIYTDGRCNPGVFGCSGIVCTRCSGIRCCGVTLTLITGCRDLMIVSMGRWIGMDMTLEDCLKSFNPNSAFKTGLVNLSFPTCNEFDNGALPLGTRESILFVFINIWGIASGVGGGCTPWKLYHRRAWHNSVLIDFHQPTAEPWP